MSGAGLGALPLRSAIALQPTKLPVGRRAVADAQVGLGKVRCEEDMEKFGESRMGNTNYLREDSGKDRHAGFCEFSARGVAPWREAGARAARACWELKSEKRFAESTDKDEIMLVFLKTHFFLRAARAMGAGYPEGFALHILL